jgi:hypothetical protein
LVRAPWNQECRTAIVVYIAERTPAATKKNSQTGVEMSITKSIQLPKVSFTLGAAAMALIGGVLAAAPAHAAPADLAAANPSVAAASPVQLAASVTPLSSSVTQLSALPGDPHGGGRSHGSHHG